jgi:hypothetical protein
MRPVQILTAFVFAAAVALTGCAPHPTAIRPPQTLHAPQPPPDTTGPASAPVDRQAAVYATVLRQFLTSGDDSFGDRFPRIFVLDHAIAGTGTPTRRATTIGGGPISPAARHAITNALADVGPVAFVASPDAVIVDRHGCARVRDQGMLVTLGPLIGMGDRVEVGVNGFVACLGAAWVTYLVGWTGQGWVVHQTTRGPVA